MTTLIDKAGSIFSVICSKNPAHMSVRVRQLKFLEYSSQTKGPPFVNINRRFLNMSFKKFDLSCNLMF
jgi:hypothetical protein